MIRSSLVALAVVPTLFGLASRASADVTPTCASLQNPVYLQVGDTQTNLMKALGRKLRDNTPNPITLVFITSGSCTNIDEMYNQDATITANMQYIPSTLENPTWNQGSATLPCTPAAGLQPDVGNSALFNSSCTTEAAPADLNVIDGPIQAYVMAVPKLSDQQAITAEEAYFVFGFGEAGMVMPWEDESEMFIRTITKSTLLTWAANIGVPGARWKGVMNDASATVVSDLTGAATPENAIGILGDEVYDGDRDSLTVLAYRAYGQYAAYFPDSTFTSRDKKNIRDGHYTVWSPTTWMYYFDPTTGDALNPDAEYVVDLITGHDSDAIPTANFAAPDVVASVGLVPDCAMAVQRSFDGGPLSLYSPDQSCVCRYEATVDTTTCTTCDDADPCATGVCRDGYCEAN